MTKQRLTWPSWIINGARPGRSILGSEVNIILEDGRQNWRWTRKETRVSAAADRPARRRCSAHVKYSISHRMVIKLFLLLGLAAEYRSRRWVWSTVVRRPSNVYDTQRRTKLTAPETTSRSRYMVGAHQNLFTWPNHAPIRDGLPSVGYHLLPSTYLSNLKLLTKMSKMGWFGVEWLRVTLRSLKVTENSTISFALLKLRSYWTEVLTYPTCVWRPHWVDAVGISPRFLEPENYSP